MGKNLDDLGKSGGATFHPIKIHKSLHVYLKWTLTRVKLVCTLCLLKLNMVGQQNWKKGYFAKLYTFCTMQYAVAVSTTEQKMSDL